MQCLICAVFQIAGLLKDNEKIQSNPEVPPSEDDTEIKKIKKVRSDCFVLSRKTKVMQRGRPSRKGEWRDGLCKV